MVARLNSRSSPTFPIICSYLGQVIGLFTSKSSVVLIYSANRYKEVFKSGLPRSLKILESPGTGIRKVLEFGLWSLKIRMGKNLNDLFVITGHNTFDVAMFENQNGGSIFPQKQIL